MKASQSGFAAMIGKSKSYVTALKQAGRLVMDGDMVDVEASKMRIAETAGGRDDMAEKHAARRGGQMPEAEGASMRRVDAQARKEHLAAELLQIELDERRGKLFVAEEVLHVVADAYATARTRLEGFRDTLAPQLAAVPDEQQVRAIIADNVEIVLQELSDRMARIGGGA